MSPSKRAGAGRQWSSRPSWRSSNACTTSRLTHLTETGAFRDLLLRQLIRQPDFVWTGPGQVRKESTLATSACKSRVVGSRLRTVRSRQTSSSSLRPTDRFELLALISNKQSGRINISRHGGFRNLNQVECGSWVVSITNREAARIIQGNIHSVQRCITGLERLSASHASTTNTSNPSSGRPGGGMRWRSRVRRVATFGNLSRRP